MKKIAQLGLLLFTLNAFSEVSINTTSEIAQLGLLLFTLNAFSEVSINTTSSITQIDIRSGNQTTPLSSDGIIFSKIDAFPKISTKVLQYEMIVYFIAVSTDNQSGFIIKTNTLIKQARNLILVL